MAGRPLRFLALTCGGWTAIRVAALWPGVDPTAAVVRALVPHAIAEEEPRPIVAARVATRLSAARPTIVAKASMRAATGRLPWLQPKPPFPIMLVTPREYEGSQPGLIPPPLRLTPIGPSRLTGSAWFLARGGTRGALLGGQLGASQAGFRVAYALGEARRFAITARVATPLSGRGREAAIGVEWRPLRALRVIAEQRIALDGGRGGPSALVVGGIDPMPIAAGFRLEAYGQAGAVVRDRIDAFADGAARIARPVLHIQGATLDLGIGAWGGAQRDAQRLDVGPTVGLSVRIGKRTARLTLDWRERVAGGAQPGSGPALSLGTDF